MTFQQRHELVGVRAPDLVHLPAGPADSDLVRPARLPQPEVLPEVALGDITGATQHFPDLTPPARGHGEVCPDAGAVRFRSCYLHAQPVVAATVVVLE